MIYISSFDTFIIFIVLVIVGCILYFKAMTSLIMSQTISRHTDKASMDWWGLNLGAMKCVINNPYKKDKKIASYVKNARIALAIMVIVIVVFFISIL